MAGLKVFDVSGGITSHELRQMGTISWAIMANRIQLRLQKYVDDYKTELTRATREYLRARALSHTTNSAHRTSRDFLSSLERLVHRA